MTERLELVRSDASNLSLGETVIVVDKASSYAGARGGVVEIRDSGIPGFDTKIVKIKVTHAVRDLNCGEHIGIYAPHLTKVVKETNMELNVGDEVRVLGVNPDDGYDSDVWMGRRGKITHVGSYGKGLEYRVKTLDGNSNSQWFEEHLLQKVNEETETASYPVGVNAELEEFKKKVVRVALALAEEHGFCEVVQNALHDKLGLGDLLPKPKDLIVTLRLRSDLLGELSNSSSDEQVADVIYVLSSDELEASITNLEEADSE